MDLRVAAVQMDARLWATDENLAHAARLVEQAAGQGAQLVVLPEMFSSGYEYTDRNLTGAEPLDGLTGTWLIETARQHNIYLMGSFPARLGRDQYIVAMLAEPSGRRWVYRKNHVAFWENIYYARGGETDMLNWFGRLYRWACHRLYNEFAWTYDGVSWLVSLGHWWSWRIAALDYLLGPRVLEVGFGTGDLLIEMARQGWDVYGLDLSPAMHRLTACKMRRCGVWAPRVRGLVQALPFPNGTFHSIVATYPAEFILQPLTWQEFERVLTPGGRLIVTGASLHADNWFLQLIVRVVFGDLERSQPPWHERVAATAGLRVTEIEHSKQPVQMQVIIAEKPA